MLVSHELAVFTGQMAEYQEFHTVQPNKVSALKV